MRPLGTREFQANSALKKIKTRTFSAFSRRTLLSKTHGEMGKIANEASRQTRPSDLRATNPTSTTTSRSSVDNPPETPSEGPDPRRFLRKHGNSENPCRSRPPRGSLRFPFSKRACAPMATERGPPVPVPFPPAVPAASRRWASFLTRWALQTAADGPPSRRPRGRRRRRAADRCARRTRWFDSGKIRDACACGLGTTAVRFRG